MIEKLDVMKDTRNVIDKDGIAHKVANFTAIGKINTLVEAVNAMQNLWLEVATVKKIILELQNRAENVQLNTESRPENVQDKFAEQRKWIGCVCRFWYDNPDNTVLDYLGEIQTGENGIEYYGKETYDWFPHCEPILPTDNAIYKGQIK